LYWVLYNIPVTVNSLPEGVKVKDLPKGTLQGPNDWEKQATVGHVRPSVNTDIFLNFRLWILFFRISRAQQKQNSKKP
jgi:phosphatidylethanolamine-binding protein (PEBP) family uncharacterized protein